LGGIVVGKIKFFVKKNRTAGFKGEREGRGKICGPELFKVRYVKSYWNVWFLRCLYDVCSLIPSIPRFVFFTSAFFSKKRAK
jgi:hypothetical protein